MEATKHSVSIVERRRAELDGILGILAFDDGYISLDTSLGKLVIEGEGLRVENLSKESGKILLVGTVNSLYYERKKEKRSRG
ncbi:MAG: YabP/YqfC family sporulation protein [Clostridia bacterium]|nr:YabP/YqfC family sporulation protein [Clostridia bacterium]